MTTHFWTPDVCVRSVRRRPLSGDSGAIKRVGAFISGTSPRISAFPDHHNYLRRDPQRVTNHESSKNSIIVHLKNTRVVSSLTIVWVCLGWFRAPLTRRERTPLVGGWLVWIPVWIVGTPPRARTRTPRDRADAISCCLMHRRSSAE